MEESPDDGEVWAALGTARFNLGNPRGAAEALARAADLLPGHWRVLCNLGAAQTALGQNEAAARTARRLTEVRSNGADLARTWGQVRPSTGGCVRTFEGHPSLVSSVAISPDVRLALSGSADSDVISAWRQDVIPTQPGRRYRLTYRARGDEGARFRQNPGIIENGRPPLPTSYAFSFGGGTYMTCGQPAVPAGEEESQMSHW